MTAINKLARFFHRAQAAHYNRRADQEESDLLAYCLTANGRILSLRAIAAHHTAKADGTFPTAPAAPVPSLVPGIAISSTHNLRK